MGAQESDPAPMSTISMPKPKQCRPCSGDRKQSRGLEEGWAGQEVGRSSSPEARTCTSNQPGSAAGWEP